MGIFICSKCGCVDNTAVSSYWSLTNQLFKMIYEPSLKGFEGKPLCCECGTIVFDQNGNNARVVPGKWHGKFDKKPPTEDQKKRINKDSIIESRNK